jgi:CheY-like chemotaxis protein
VADILIIEDDDDIREILAEMLTDRGYPVVTACNGAEGLAAMRAGPVPCMVLLDLMMPIMDGWTLRAEMLADPALAQIPVVVVSGAADLESKTSELKAARVLTKPVKWPVLLDSVRAYC